MVNQIPRAGTIHSIRIQIRFTTRENTEDGTANSYSREAVLITISSVSRETTKYSPGERPASCVTRSLAVSMSSTASIQTGVPRRSFLNISKGVALIEQPSLRIEFRTGFWGTPSKTAFSLPAFPFLHCPAYFVDCTRLTGIHSPAVTNNPFFRTLSSRTTSAFFTYSDPPVAVLQFASQNTYLHSFTGGTECIAAS